jgi:hypothetical protein
MTRRVFVRRLATFYDSQSGTFMAKPGSAGLRFHVHGCGQAPAFPLKGCTYVLPLPAGACGAPTRPHATLFFSASQPADLEILAAPRLGVALSLPPEGVAAVLPLLARARALFLPTHVTLRRCWRAAPGAHPDANAAARMVEDAVGALCDAGAGVVALRDCGGAATEESLRELVEGAFNLDVAGDAVMERLSVGVGVPGLLEAALSMGVTRFECGGEGLLSLDAAAAAAKAELTAQP